MQKVKLHIKIQNLFLLFILVMAFFLRVYKIAEYPAGLNADEAAIGYNAYSLLQTGKDEFGHSWPINFQSFNDYKPGFYFYLVLPFVKIFGLSVLAVRLPSVILGTLTVFLIYLLADELFNSYLLSLISSLLLAISPWHLHFSRGGWETNAATFFMIAGVYLFLISLEKPKFFLLSALGFLLSMFTYHSARIISPLLVLGLTLFYWRKIFIKENLKPLILAVGIGGMLLLTLLVSMGGQAGASRFSGVGIFADQGPYWRANELRGQHQDPYSIFPKIIHNKYLEYGFRFFDNYLRHFNGDFLFISGDEIQRNRIPEMGQMYLVEFPFLVLGLYFLLKNRPKNWPVPIFWLAVAPLASSLTFQSPHAIRSLNMVIPLVILTAYGIYNLLFILKRTPPIFRYSLFIIPCLFFFSFYLHQYYIHYPQTYPAAWEDGFSQLAEYLSQNGGRYNRIYITNKYDQPYILTAFFLKYPPELFQKEARLTEKDQFGFSTVANFGKYYFGPINWEEKPIGQKVLLVGTTAEVPESATIIKRIYFKDGRQEAFRIVEQ